MERKEGGCCVRTYLIEYVRYSSTAVKIVHLYTTIRAPLAVYPVRYACCKLGKQIQECAACQLMTR